MKMRISHKLQKQYDELSVVPELIDQLSACRTTYDVFGIMKQVCELFGYRYFMVLRLNSNGEFLLSKMAIVTNWDPELLRAFDSLDLSEERPLIVKLRNTTVPISWTNSELYAGSKYRLAGRLRKLFKGYSMDSGIYVPVSDKMGNRGAVGMSGESRELDQYMQAQFSYIADHVYECLVNMEELIENIPNILTARELDCVRWAAAGKTGFETAEILGISENTVSHYLTNASLKLDTVNKAHTVARAIRRGLID